MDKVDPYGATFNLDGVEFSDSDEEVTAVPAESGAGHSGASSGAGPATTPAPARAAASTTPASYSTVRLNENFWDYITKQNASKDVVPSSPPVKSSTLTDDQLAHMEAKKQQAVLKLQMKNSVSRSPAVATSGSVQGTVSAARAQGTVSVSSSRGVLGAAGSRVHTTAAARGGGGAMRARGAQRPAPYSRTARPQVSAASGHSGDQAPAAAPAAAPSAPPAPAVTTAPSATIPAAASAAPGRAIDLEFVNMELTSYLELHKNENSRASELLVVKTIDETLESVGIKEGKQFKKFDECDDDPETLADQLCKFFVHCVKKNGEFYRASTLDTFNLAISRYLRERKGIDTSTHPAFEKVKYYLKVYHLH